MKKITFALFALIAGTTFAQNSVKGTAEVKAIIVQPITISSEGALDFGTIASPEVESATVTLSPGNVRDIPTEMVVPGNTTTSVPTFTVTKEEGLTYKIVTSSTDLSLEGQKDISLSNITTNLGENGNENVTDTSFTVGATIGLNKNQGPGTYKGEVAVTVSYE